MNDQRKGEKITRYGIKKYSFGAASVAVAFGIYFANGPVVTAQEVSNATSTEASLELPATSASEVASAETPAPESQASESSANQSSEAESATRNTLGNCCDGMGKSSKSSLYKDS